MEERKVSGEVPFMFINSLGHDTKAMERFFSMPEQARRNLEASVCAADDPEARAYEVIASLSKGKDGYKHEA